MELLRVIDTHTGGEPTRVVTGGIPDLGSGPMEERRERLRTDFDWIRTSVVDEPRGSDVVVGALLCDPVDPSFDAGIIFFNNVGYLHMCGHGTIGVAVALRHLGRAREGDLLRFETPVGPVEARLGSGGQVTIRNVPAYRFRKGVEVNVDGATAVTGDVAWGGNWFFLSEDHGQDLSYENIPALTSFCRRIRDALEEEGVTGEDSGGIDHIELIADCPELEEADGRSFVLCPGGAYDRSPCGTGTSAKLACLYADGKLSPGETWTQASIIGSLFRGSFEVENGGSSIVPAIQGEAWVSGELTIQFDPADPYRFGINAESVR